MPLKLDKRLRFYRGPHAVHVKRHAKLGKHRTVAKEVLPIVDYLVDREDIKRVALGKVAGGHFTPRVSHEVRGTRVKFLFVGEHSAQTILVEPKSQESAKSIVFAVARRWMHHAVAKHYLACVHYG